MERGWNAPAARPRPLRARPRRSLPAHRPRGSGNRCRMPAATSHTSASTRRNVAQQDPRFGFDGEAEPARCERLRPELPRGAPAQRFSMLRAELSRLLTSWPFPLDKTRSGTGSDTRDEAPVDALDRGSCELLRETRPYGNDGIVLNTPHGVLAPAPSILAPPYGRPPM